MNEEKKENEKQEPDQRLAKLILGAKPQNEYEERLKKEIEKLNERDVMIDIPSN